MADEFAAAGDDFHGSAVSHRVGWRDELADPAGFAAWVEQLHAEEQAVGRLPDGFVPSSLRWMTDSEGCLLGTIHLRHSIDHPYLRTEGGHIGYGVRPSARRRGVATTALRLMVELAAGRGIDPLLLTCKEDNVGSARTIQSCGGLREGKPGVHVHYWVAMRSRPGEEPVQPAEVEVRAIAADEAEDLLARRRRPDWHPDFPRDDDRDGVGMAREHGTGGWGSHAVVRRRDGLVVGTVGFFGPPDDDGEAEVGYGLVEDARGSGLATAAVAWACRWAEANGARSLRAHIAPDNLPSRRLALRCGFVDTGEVNDDGDLCYRRGHVESARPVGV